MAYTPELSMKHSSTLRRVAWSLGVPMTEAIELVFDYVAKVIDRNMVCDCCRDKTRCEDCVFNNT